MSKRLQVVVADEELEGYAEVARVSGLTLSEWVRQTLRREQREISLGDVESKLEVVRRATSLNLGPETDIETMLAEIEAGYEQDLPEL
ncbi:MAG: antitoxin [Solirubrobacteraceae bacterium]